MRLTAAAGSLARPCRATSSSDCAISSGALASAAGIRVPMRTSHPARENTLAHARPISPTPTTRPSACAPPLQHLCRSLARTRAEMVALAPYAERHAFERQLGQ